ncbi:MAG: peptide chain release factor 1 [Chlamydiae bacterium]|jgi:peptide chain release factor 1|nr:peptide chain release factor 1 [Chlamydiota bacterium]
MQDKILQLLKRFHEVEAELGLPDCLSNQKRYKELAQEHAYLTEVKEVYEAYQKTAKSLSENKEMLQTLSDPEFEGLVKEEINEQEKIVEDLNKKLQTLLIPPNPDDNKNIILELRAGTGGDEAAIFVGDCVRMYKLYAADKGWQVEQLSCTPSELGGYKEFIMSISGTNVHRFMQFEAGTHRVQRVPETEAQGRVHTSAITVAVLKEPDEEDEIQINEADLRIDTYRASGAGGQHVNTTDSAVRITHIPTGTVVYSQEERSQHKNKDKAMRLLKAKILEEAQRKKHQEISQLRSQQVGSGDRSERIRTYNFPQNRLTDHRIELTLYKLDQIMEGHIDCVTEPLVAYYYQQALNEMK